MPPNTNSLAIRTASFLAVLAAAIGLCKSPDLQAIAAAQTISEPSSDGSTPVWFAAELARHDIPRSPDAAVAFLRECATGGRRYVAAQRDIELLGSMSFAERTAAQQRLLETPWISPRLLDEASRSANLEIAWRAEEVRRRATRHGNYLLVACLELLESNSEATTVSERSSDSLRNATTTLLQLADELPDPLVRWRLFEVLHQLSRDGAGGSAVARRAEAGDGAALLALASSTASGPAAAAGPASKTAPPPSPGTGERDAALDRLTSLRTHADPRLRIAAELLQTTKGGDRPGAVRAVNWKSVVPLVGRRSLEGKTLVATGSHGLVLEFSRLGQLEWRHPIRAWSAEPLPDGGVLVAAFEEQRIVELDRAGRIVWEFAGIAATRAKPLPDGSILATDFPGARVVEIDRRKNVVWSMPTPEGAFDVERSACGHTVFGCANLIREITPDGRTVRQIPISGRLNGLQLLPDGRILIANFGANEVAMLASDGRVEWRLAESQPSDAFLARDGNLLVTTAKRCAEFNAARELVREWTTARYGTARR